MRLEINRNSQLKMIKENNDFIILKDNKELVRGEIEHVLAHYPEQAYITLSERCIYDCTFCSVPKLQGKIKTLSLDSVRQTNACVKVLSIWQGWV
ncbi:MAG: hypothetical protein U9N41_09675 [Euryarchaeota archaeon]|nr:hypothetical protein [Euryarchaeota archaeon]